jgi:hypothetical protein
MRVGAIGATGWRRVRSDAHSVYPRRRATRNRSEGRLARDDIFAEKQAANHYHYQDDETHMTKAEAD